MFKRDIIQKLIAVGSFALAMGFLETVIVVLLRMLYYPSGFDFPLNPNMQAEVLIMELFREFFTIVMLVTVGYLAGRNFTERFGYFLYAFAIWDIFYYIWLKVIIDWPASLLTWDLLFLIPVSWIGPVLAPVICSITFIIFHLLIVWASDRNKKVKLNWKEWSLFSLGSAIIVYTWIIDYIILIIENRVNGFVPTYYNWPLFIFGELVLISAMVLFYLRYKKK